MTMLLKKMTGKWAYLIIAFFPVIFKYTTKLY